MKMSAAAFYQTILNHENAAYWDTPHFVEIPDGFDGWERCLLILVMDDGPGKFVVRSGLQANNDYLASDCDGRYLYTNDGTFISVVPVEDCLNIVTDFNE